MPSYFQKSEQGILRAIVRQSSLARQSPAILVDRDGVVNERIFGSYIAQWSEFRFIVGMIAALASLSELGVPMIVVSNQAGVGKGIVSEDSLEEITRNFVSEVTSHGARIDAVYYCPHRPHEGCSCRKPAPGLLGQAARDFNLDLKRSIFIGDTESDLRAADAVGCAFIQLSPDGQTEPISSDDRRINLQTPATLPAAVREHFRRISADANR